MTEYPFTKSSSPPGLEIDTLSIGNTLAMGLLLTGRTSPSVRNGRFRVLEFETSDIVSELSINKVYAYGYKLMF